MTSGNFKNFLWVTVFAIAMGYLETAVVIYLREIYYPAGFVFPLKPISGHLALVELFREAATIAMLAGVGILAGRKNLERFAWFIYSFAVWDIFYYIFLKLLVQWPESLVTWDILFLIPVTWVGPVYGPVINSISMIILAILIIRAINKNETIKIKLWEWLAMIIGSLIVIISYTEGYLRFMLKTFTFIELFMPSKNKEVLDIAATYVPDSFKWWIFWIGQAMIFYGIAVFYYRVRKGFSIKTQ